MKYKIEFVPRYGTDIGIISVTTESEDTNQSTETIGHIRLSDKEEQERWVKMLNQLNQEWMSGIKKHQAQKLEQDMY